MNRRKVSLVSVGLCLLFAVQLFAQDIDTKGPRQTGRRNKKIRRQDDLHAIGQRNIGGKGFGNWYSIAPETDLGRDSPRLLEQDANLLNEPVVSEYINRIGQNLARNSDAKVAFRIQVIETDEINAYAFAGGFLYVDSALITTAQDEAELAAVMAHEIAHVAAHHAAARQLTRAKMFSLVTSPIIFIGRPFRMAIEEATTLVTPFAETKFSRHLETEADYLGVEYLYLTGYDPQAFISFFERVRALEPERPGTLSKIFAMRPQTADRICKTQSEIVRILPARDLYITNTSEFDTIKLRLAEVSSRHFSEQQLTIRPTLRRRSNVELEDPRGIDERPRLQREDVN